MMRMYALAANLRYILHAYHGRCQIKESEKEVSLQDRVDRADASA
jgi:hypothetical protein